MKEDKTEFDLFIKRLMKDVASPGVIAITCFFLGAMFGLFLGSFIKFINW